MKRTAKYAGLDVHQASTAVSVRDPSGRVIARSVLPTEAAAFEEFFSGMRGPVSIALEEGTQARWLHGLLQPVAHRVVVCDRRGESRKGNKGAQLDADRLSRLLRIGELRPVYHGGPDRETLRELTRTYRSVVEDSIRVMLRLKAIFRSRAIRTPGKPLYHPAHRELWLGKLTNRGARYRAEALYAELDVLRELRAPAKAAMVAEARRDPAWDVLRAIPFMGPVRVSLLLATVQTPWRFRTKRSLWAYAGLAAVTHSSSDHDFVAGMPVRRRRAAMTRGLNRNHKRVVNDIFKGAALAAIVRPGPLRDFCHAMLDRGVSPEMARVTLARKLHLQG